MKKQIKMLVLSALFVSASVAKDQLFLQKALVDAGLATTNGSDVSLNANDVEDSQKLIRALKSLNACVSFKVLYGMDHLPLDAACSVSAQPNNNEVVFSSFFLLAKHFAIELYIGRSLPRYILVKRSNDGAFECINSFERRALQTYCNEIAVL